MHIKDFYYLHIRKLLKHGGKQSDEINLLGKNGASFIINIESTFRNDAQGNALIYSVLFDITENKKLITRFKQLFDNSTNALLITNEQGEITLTNSNMTTMFGYEGDEFIGMRIEDLIPKRYRGHHQGYRQGYMSNPESRKMGVGRDLHGLHKDGNEFPVEIGLSLIESESGSESLVLSTITNITERKRLEDDLRHMATHDPLTGFYNRRI